jgi:hypothetical protein
MLTKETDEVTGASQRQRSIAGVPRKCMTEVVTCESLSTQKRSLDTQQSRKCRSLVLNPAGPHDQFRIPRRFDFSPTKLSIEETVRRGFHSYHGRKVASWMKEMIVIQSNHQDTGTIFASSYMLRGSPMSFTLLVESFQKYIHSCGHQAPKRKTAYLIYLLELELKLEPTARLVGGPLQGLIHQDDGPVGALPGLGQLSLGNNHGLHHRLLLCGESAWEQGRSHSEPEFTA